MNAAKRMDRLPPYLFAEIERKIEQKKAQGVDVISLGIGDPDTPTPPHIVEEMIRQVSDPRNHTYPSNRGLPEFREAVCTFYRNRFGVSLDPETEVFPLLGAKEGIAHICLSHLDPGDYCLSADPGYPVYTTGPLLAGAEPLLLPLPGALGFLPDLDAISKADAVQSKFILLNYPNNPTGAVIPPGSDFFDRLVSWAREHDVIVIHDNAYSEITFEGYRAPSFLETAGAGDVGIEFFSLSKTYNMTGWRIGAAVGNAQVLEALWRLKTNIDSGLFNALQRTAVAALSGPQDSVAQMCALYTRRRNMVIGALERAGITVTPPKGTIYVWVPVPQGYTSTSFAELVLEQAGVVVSPGSGYGPAGEGFIRISLTTPDHRLAVAMERISDSLKP